MASLEAWATSTLGIFIEAAIAVLLVGSLAAWLDRRRRARRNARAKRRQIKPDAILAAR
jgi:hypothetical protein